MNVNWEHYGGDFNGYLTQDQQAARDAEWRAWVAEHNPLTHEQYKAMSRAERYRIFGHNVIMWAGVGGLRVRSGSKAVEAFHQLRNKYAEIARQASQEDRLASGWKFENGWVAPDGRRKGHSGLAWGDFASSDAHETEKSMTGS